MIYASSSTRSQIHKLHAEPLTRPIPQNPLKTGTEPGVAQHRRGAPRGIIPSTTPSLKVNDQAKRKARP